MNMMNRMKGCLGTLLSSVESVVVIWSLARKPYAYNHSSTWIRGTEVHSMKYLYFYVMARQFYASGWANARAWVSSTLVFLSYAFMLSMKLNGELRLQMTFFYTENAHQTSVCTLHVIYHRQVTLNCLFISTNGHRLHNKMCHFSPIFNTYF